MLDKILSAIFGSKRERDVKQLLPIVEKINDKDIVDLILQGRAEDLRKELLNLKSIFNTKKGATGIVEEDGTIHDFKANGQKT